VNSSQEHTEVSFDQRIPSTLDEAESLCLRMRYLLQTNGLSQLCFPIELLARECLANAVNHGNRNDPAKSIVLHFRVGRTWIRLQVSDEGAGFDWRKATREMAAIREVSGRGLQLYALYAARFQFNRCGNRITLWIDKKKRTGNGD
jgi:anti-sigma regulatory factor (Ser/Thr protein kinase)